ncbi:hypothetical protein GLOIN_2v1475732 [Rhizophagus irregularis DAOM 181602=DAOM 197198]|uniref:CDP-diacylglycerol--inositol 3-phosphatidyltransferase n=1 Tax=Rhizophagus irregularis (strain DAOM 181602 / DAOM 197198 / MUCL 43194) TaxID=747089 RepID=A0A2P4QBR2_RHIID|nr:hypothetical protein GLOIN_2v1475732 [Rhizophagus irregularis DAOM 181602=DAOM 197198]POG75057.1 hypothetical protein GLOIN_2v1475732 [Rhizophagus irregularis DAOM 181602=DAOM 197198]|eukprot:XP_025181923.1 hypothetical protein GLOIN_2v1475732 [Rhizophagus irregularis DAOM 181602=DAOM 197198]
MAHKIKQQLEPLPPSPKIQEVKNVFLFIPNIIGFIRVILAILSLYYMPNKPWTCMGLYTFSCLLDAVDGNAARYFDQCSEFGVVLDMVTDRSTTSCLLCFLATKYSSWTILFQLLISLDLSSHYMHMYSSMTSGSSSHKNIDKSSNSILRAYYSNNVGFYVVLFIFCALNELFFVALYLLSFNHEDIAPGLNFIIRLIAFFSFPVCAGKQIINVIQLAGASKRLASIDLAEQRKISKNGENVKNN